MAGPAAAADDLARWQKGCAKASSVEHRDCVRLYEALARMGVGCQRGAGTDCATLAAFARADAEGVSAAIRALSDPAVLAEIARDTSRSSFSRRAAVENPFLQDPAVLTDVARSADSFETRDVAQAAIEKLHDPAALGTVAMEAKDDLAGMHAIARLTDRKLLNEIAKAKPGRARSASQRLQQLGTTTLTGVLVEELTGTPLAAFPFEIADHRVLTDSEGRFRVTDVKAGDWALFPKDQGPIRQLYDAKGPVKLAVPASGEAALGSVVVRDRTHVGRRLGGLCEPGAQRPELPSGAKLFTFFDDGNGRSYTYDSEQSYRWTAWPAALCIRTAEGAIGSYVTRSGAAAGAAKTAVWWVRLIRLSDGQAFETRLTQEPPRESRGTAGATGDPTPKLVKWLETIR